jgi:hypothetical protein
MNGTQVRLMITNIWGVAYLVEGYEGLKFIISLTLGYVTYEFIVAFCVQVKKEYKKRP